MGFAMDMGGVWCTLVKRALYAWVLGRDLQPQVTHWLRRDLKIGPMWAYENVLDQ